MAAAAAAPVGPTPPIENIYERVDDLRDAASGSASTMQRGLPPRRINSDRNLAACHYYGNYEALPSCSSNSSTYGQYN